MADEKDSDSPYDFAPLSDPLAPRERQTIKKPAAENRPPAQPDAPDTPVEPAYERICPHCGYKILTKPQKGRCPECAGALDVAANLLQFADYDWLTKMSNGVLLVVGCVALHVAAIIMVATGRGSVGDLIHAAAAAIGAAGVWMATTSEPAAPAPTSPYAPLAPLLAIAAAALWAISLLFPPANPHLTRLHMVAVVLAMAVMAVEAVVVGLHLRILAARVPNDSLATHLVNAGLLTGGMCLILGILKAVGVVTGDVQYSFFCSFPMIGCMILVTLWALISLVRTALEIRNSAVAGQLIIQRQEQRAAKAAAEREAANKR